MINNPVLHKELMLRFRVRQPTPARIGIAAAIVILIGWLYWYGMSYLLRTTNPTDGAGIWSTLIGGQYMLVCLLAPSLTANSITQEKEQQTWEMLVFTRLQPSEILLGKLIARLVSIVLLLAVFLPLTLFSWYIAASHGQGTYAYVSPGHLLSAYLVIIVSSIFFATIGLFSSALLKRTLYAIILSYTIVIGILCIATGVITGALNSLSNDPNFAMHCPLLWFNPIMLISVPLEHTPEPGSVAALTFGLIGYATATMLMLWFMIARFRQAVQEAV